MSEELRLLAARKQLLLARSRLHRLEVILEARALRRSVARPATFLSIAASPAVRPLVVGALMMLLGRSRVSKFLRGALTAIAIAKAALALLRRDEPA